MVLVLHRGIYRMCPLLWSVVLALASLPCLSGLDNGLALTPPMGWLTWQRYRCNTDCQNYPDDCISEKLIRRTADCLVSQGFRDLGYQYVTIDDCWLAKSRDSQGRLQPDPDRFPSGIKALADYVHSKGLKFGIYEDFGTHTCAGFPGSEFYMELDANTFAGWGVDLLKFDGCYSDYKDDMYGYPAMGLFLNKTGRPIVYSCEWPLYNVAHKAKPDFAAIRQTCNLWRNYDDIQDSWQSLQSILDYFRQNDKNFSAYAGPGGWNDPDMLIIGNYGLSDDQERLQMAMWSLLASPLILSLDACNVRPSSKAILQNRRVLAVSQDRLGKQATLIIQDGNIQVWSRPILPAGSYALGFINTHSGGGPDMFVRSLKELGLTSPAGYRITDTFEGSDLGSLKPAENFKTFVNPTGVTMITAVPISA